MAKRIRRGAEPGNEPPARTLALVPAERIERAILLIRGEKVILDADLAELYGVSTRRLNEQVRRNRDRFPPDFLIELTAAEKAELVELVAEGRPPRRLKYSSSLPLAFTEHGAIMAANVLSFSAGGRGQRHGGASLRPPAADARLARRSDPQAR